MGREIAAAFAYPLRHLERGRNSRRFADGKNRGPVDLARDLSRRLAQRPTVASLTRVYLRMSLLKETIAAIAPLDNEAARRADERLNSLTKPGGSLGYLEELVRRYAAIRHDGSAQMGHGAIAVFVADHGVA